MDNEDEMMALAMGEIDEMPATDGPQQMDDEEFCRIVGSATEIARRYNESGDARTDRSLSLAYYNGEAPDLIVNENRSQMVSNDLRSVVAKVQPSVMRTFFSSQQVVDYTSDDTDDAELVEGIRDAINDQFIRHGGYVAAESAIFDSLIHDEGVIRYDIDQQADKITFEAVPPEKLLITPDARSEDAATLIGSWSEVTRSSLIERGYDRQKVMEAAETSRIGSAEDIERGLLDQDIDLGEAAEEIECFEIFVRIDYDGDGIAELRRVVFVGDCTPETVLLNEKVARRRIFLTRSENMPHSARGRGLYRDVLDIQKAKTALLRAAMDNIAAVNDPTTAVDLTMVSNPEDMLARKRGAILLVNGFPPGGVMQTISVPPTAALCFDAMRYYDAALIDRTGVSGAASGMLPDVLQGQTAAAVNMIQSGGTARVELICRNIAECTFRPMFEAIFLDVAEMTGVMVELKDTSINVGLGSGTRERDMQALGNVMSIQEKLISAFGPPETNPHVNHKNLSNTLNKLVEVAGLRAKDAYFKTPTDEEIQKIAMAAQSRKSPDQMKIEAQMQMEDKKMAVQRDKEMSQAQADIAVKQTEMQKDEARLRQEAERSLMETEARMTIEREKIASQERIAMAKLNADRQNAMIAAGQEVAVVDPETGAPQPTQSEMMIAALSALVGRIDAMQAAQLAPRVMTTPDGRTYTSSIATVN